MTNSLRHMDHVEDSIWRGPKEARTAVASLRTLLGHLVDGGSLGKHHLSVKYDGSPAVVFGRDRDGKFFASTKSALNKTPKVCYTLGDVCALTKSVEVRCILETLLTYMPSCVPMSSGVAYQADVIGFRSPLDRYTTTWKTLKTNVVEYAPKSPTTTWYGPALMVVAVHTVYDWLDGSATNSTPYVGFGLNSSSEVAIVDPTPKKAKRSAEQSTKLKSLYSSLEFARVVLNEVDRRGRAGAVYELDDRIVSYFHSRVRDRKRPIDATSTNISAYLLGLDSRGKPRASKKSVDDLHFDDVNDLLDVYDTIYRVKTDLLAALGNPTDFDHYIDGASCGPEGFVLWDYTERLGFKLVDRMVFSRANFKRNDAPAQKVLVSPGASVQVPAPKDASEVSTERTITITEKEVPCKLVFGCTRGFHACAQIGSCLAVLSEPTRVQEVEERPGKCLVYAYGRFNPPTRGHELLVDKIKELQSSYSGAIPIAVRIDVSLSHGDSRNPLSIERRLVWLDRLFPNDGWMFQAAPAVGDGSIYAQLLNLSAEGVTDLVLVAGGDRVGDYERILRDYNERFLHFDAWQVVDAGRRDYTSTDPIEGVSSTVARTAVKNRDFRLFCGLLPRDTTVELASELFDELKAGASGV